MLEVGPFQILMICYPTENASLKDVEDTEVVVIEAVIVTIEMSLIREMTDRKEIRNSMTISIITIITCTI